MNPSKVVSKIKLKRDEKTQSCEAKILSKISCKIGDHFVNAYINTGSSISIASTDLYRKLVDEKCSFKEGKGTLHVIDESIPDQEYRITSTTVQVIGRTKSINLVAFPNIFTKKITLGIDFLTTKSSAELDGSEDFVFQVPEKPIPRSKQKQKHSKETDNPNQPIALLDWILNSSNLKKPLYNILADGTAEDEDLLAICAFMKRLPRPVSPIRHFEKPCNKKLLDTKLAANDTSNDKTQIVCVTSSTSKASKDNAN